MELEIRVSKVIKVTLVCQDQQDRMVIRDQKDQLAIQGTPEILVLWALQDPPGRLDLLDNKGPRDQRDHLDLQALQVFFLNCSFMCNGTAILISSFLSSSINWNGRLELRSGLIVSIHNSYHSLFFCFQFILLSPSISE